jgi:RND family efflux transporter MFP subunit
LDAKEDLARAETLRTRNAMSKKELEDAQRSVATAEASKKRAEAALQLAKAGPTPEQIEVAKAQLELAKADVALKQDSVDKCIIKCPLETAWVVERYVGVGDHVTATPSTPLMRIVDSSILLAQVNVPERYQGLVKFGDLAKLSAQGGHEAGQVAVDAMVVLVNAQIDPDTRTFRVRVGIDNSKNLFKPGTFTKVELQLDTQDALVVPVDAVTFSDGKPAAFVVRDGITNRVPLELGISNRTQYQVVSGLSENDLVVKGSLSMLAPDMRVEKKAKTNVGAEGSPAQDVTSPATPAQG